MLPIICHDETRIALYSLVHLQKLYANCNYLTDLPAGMSQLSKLQVLDVSYNYLTHLSYEVVQLATSSSSLLRSVDLSGNPLIREAPLMDEKVSFGSFPSVPIPVVAVPSEEVDDIDTTPSPHPNSDDARDTLMNGNGDASEIDDVDITGVAPSDATTKDSNGTNSSNVSLSISEPRWRSLLSISSLRVSRTFATPNHIIDNLYIGDYDAAKNKVALQELGITHIVTV
jgi:hypothetical protein